MSQENDSYLRDLEQIAQHTRVNAEAFTTLIEHYPEHADDLKEMQQSAFKHAGDLEELAERARQESNQDQI